MVFESLLSISSIREKPYLVIIIAILGSIIAVLLTNYLSKGGLFLVFLIVLAILPVTISNLKREEKKKEYDHFWEYLYKLNFFWRHLKIIIYYLSIVAGISLTIATIYLLAPADFSNQIFSDQIRTVHDLTGNFNSPSFFLTIFMNNLLVMTTCFVFSLFYSSGAIFLISWNASVLGVVVGQGAKELCSSYALPTILGAPFVPSMLLSYALHGLPEFLGYILAGIAGGLLSVAISRHKENKTHRMFVVKDSLFLFFIGVFFIFLGAIIESFLI